MVRPVVTSQADSTSSSRRFRSSYACRPTLHSSLLMSVTLVAHLAWSHEQLRDNNLSHQVLGGTRPDSGPASGHPRRTWPCSHTPRSTSAYRRSWSPLSPFPRRSRSRVATLQGAGGRVPISRSGARPPRRRGATSGRAVGPPHAGCPNWAPRSTLSFTPRAQPPLIDPRWSKAHAFLRP